MPLSKKNLDRICITIIIIVSVLCGYWVVNNGIRQKLAIQKNKELLTRQINNLQLAEASAEQLKTILDEKNDGLKILREKIPESAKLGNLIKHLDAMIKNREIDLQTLQPLPGVKEEFYTRIPVRLIFKGSFINVYQLLHDFEVMDRILRMDNIVIAQIDIENLCRVELMASVFTH